MARHYARELALKVLYEHDVAGAPLTVVLDRTLAGASMADGDYARQLVQGTVSNREQIDEWLGGAAREWRIQRMPPIDRNILRLGCYEMVWEQSVPLSVVIDEALELARVYSTDEAKRFVNGVLGAIAEKVRPEGDRDRP